MFRTSTIALSMAALVAVAAAPAGDVEIVDGCDPDSHVAGQPVDHPTIEGTNIDTVDLQGVYAGEDEDYVGLDVVFEMCGDVLDVSTRERIAVGWQGEGGVLDGCDATGTFLTFDRDLESGTFSATATLSCHVHSDCTDPLGIRSCSQTTASEVLEYELPADAFDVDGRTLVAQLRPAALPGELAATLAEGGVLSHLYSHGSSFAGTNVFIGAGQRDGTVGANVQVVDRGEGSDHVLGRDRR